jgi:hypothetical protein
VLIVGELFAQKILKHGERLDGHAGGEIGFGAEAGVGGGGVKSTMKYSVTGGGRPGGSS